MWFLWEKHRAFLNAAAPAIPAPYWRQRQRAEEGGGDSPPAIFAVWWLLSPSGKKGGFQGTGWIAKLDHYCTKAEKEVTLEGDKRLMTLFLFDVRIGARWSCVFGRIFPLLRASWCVSVRRSAPHVLNGIYSSSDGAPPEHPEHYTAWMCLKEKIVLKI